jgi:hypothetical protein
MAFQMTWHMIRGFLVLDELPFYATSDERIVEIQGEHLKVLKALQASVGHLRKFLVDHSVIPLFEQAVSLSSSALNSMIFFFFVFCNLLVCIIVQFAV